VFASDPHAARLAEQLGATHVPVDPHRRSVPISASMIRNAPMKHWDFLPPVVRPHYVRRVHVLGAESTGKSTLSKRLADRFGTRHVSEYARTLAESRGSLEESELTLCARLQIASERALERQATRVLISDTSALSVKLWGERLFGHAPLWIDDEIAAHPPHLALLTSPEAPFIGPASRNDPKARRAFYIRHRDVLHESSTPHVVLTGSFDHQFVQAVDAIERLIASE
jgi:NadR type nicotinamide-nucleotide adenylyltransferase